MNLRRGFRRLALIVFFLWELFAVAVFANEARNWWTQPWHLVDAWEEFQFFVRETWFGLAGMIAVPIAAYAAYRAIDWVRAGFSN